MKAEQMPALLEGALKEVCLIHQDSNPQCEADNPPSLRGVLRQLHFAADSHMASRMFGAWYLLNSFIARALLALTIRYPFYTRPPRPTSLSQPHSR